MLPDRSGSNTCGSSRVICPACPGDPPSATGSTAGCSLGAQKRCRASTPFPAEVRAAERPPRPKRSSIHPPACVASPESPLQSASAGVPPTMQVCGRQSCRRPPAARVLPAHKRRTRRVPLSLEQQRSRRRSSDTAPPSLPSCRRAPRRPRSAGRRRTRRSMTLARPTHHPRALSTSRHPTGGCASIPPARDDRPHRRLPRCR
mmetsp:Transcript_31712/g.83058  ORF Transcript_31712/g.83058 Transcript_31712/m.83058 type:complete len:203 (+) Transcript_31712:235-843(+)